MQSYVPHVPQHRESRHDCVQLGPLILRGATLMVVVGTPGEALGTEAITVEIIGIVTVSLLALQLARMMVRKFPIGCSEWDAR